MKKQWILIVIIIFISSNFNDAFCQNGKFWDKINDGLDNLNSNVQSKLGYYQYKGKWEYFGGGCWDSFGNFRKELAYSPFNKHFVANLQTSVQYHFLLKSPNQKGFGIAIFDEYGEQVYFNSLQHQTGVIDELFQVNKTGEHRIILFTARAENDATYDQNGVVEFSINSKYVTEKNYLKKVIENENFGELGGGGVGRGINNLGGTVDTHIFSPRNISYVVDLASESNFHTILETFNLDARITIVDPFGNMVSSGNNEARCEVSKGGKYKVTISTSEKDKRGRFNVYFAGNLLDNPLKINYNTFIKTIDTKEGECFKLKIIPKENSLIDFKIISPNNTCKLNVFNNSSSNIQTLPNPWDQSVVLNNNDDFWTISINCSEYSSQKTTFYVFGNFLLEDSKSKINPKIQVTPSNFEKNTTEESENIKIESDNANKDDLEDLAFVANKNPTFENLYKLGKAYWDIENFESAIFNLNRAYTIKPDDPKLNYYLGAIYFSKSSNDEVSEVQFKEYIEKSTGYFEKAHQLKPQDCLIVSALNLCYNIQKINKKLSCENKSVLNETNKNIQIKGKIKSENFSENTLVYALDNQTKKKYLGNIDRNEKTFVIDIVESKDYLVVIEDNGKLGNSVLVKKGGSYIVNDLELISYKSGNTITFRNINFHTGKSMLLPESFSELDKIANFLIDKKNLKIEIIGHTDDQGTESDNLKLSQERAEAVSYYLIAKGLKNDSFIIKGLGEGVPLSKGIDETSRYLNRRVEFKIL